MADQQKAEKGPICNCPRIDGYVLIKQGCGHHPEARARREAARNAPPEVESTPDPDAVDLACAWTDYRNDYGTPQVYMNAAYKAFAAGWKAAREGDQSGALR